MTILVVGHRGMLGRDLLSRLHRAGFATSGTGRPETDITQAANVQQTLREVAPDIVINTAAYTAVDQAEVEPETAFAVNRDGAAHLAQACQQRSIPLLHISTDYVFDGTATHPYHEDASIGPLGSYGQSKWAGEAAIRDRHREHLIIRTSWLYGRHGNNFVKTILRLAREQSVLRVVHDQTGCPTWTGDLSCALVVMCQRIQQQTHNVPWGTYHFCGAGQTTWYHFARYILREARRFEPLVTQEVVPIPTLAYPTPARRPAYSVLQCRKIQAAFGITPRPWQDSLPNCIRELYT